jgi:hypothetical protein
MSQICGCSGTCGCCEGVEPVTPVTIVNRPGLDRLSYRVGTHGRFLETMLSQLSQHELAVPTPRRDEQGQQIVDLIRPLHALRTRHRDDPSIALLDAWATVAHVLTFYQERIANEGYLRTAGERRSVLELGRLLGYRMRPGVAATCYLAYRLEKGSRATIQAGSKVQSIPRPGELPQTFETIEEAEARGEWNTLQVASTRPVDEAALADVSSDRTKPLYFNGIATRLERNDPLLMDFGDFQELYRVIDVEPDSIENRTTVSVRPWQEHAVEDAGAPEEAAATATADEGGPDEVTILSDVATRFTDLTSADAPRPGATVRRVVDLLERLQTNVMLGLRGLELRELAVDDILPAIEDERRRLRGRSGPVEAWLSRLVQELHDFRSSTEAQIAAPVAASVATNGASDDGAGVAWIGSALEQLAEPPSLQPDSPRELSPSLETTFGSSSETLPSLLTVMRPELEPVLYDAWRNLEATPPSQLRVYALRARASAFGHAAPLEAVKNAAGLVVSTREWTLVRSEGTVVPEAFEVSLVIPRSEFGSPPPMASIVVSIAQTSAEASLSLSELLATPLKLGLGTDEDVLIEVTSGDSESSRGTVKVSFVQRAMTFELSLETGTALRWSSQGSDPTDLRFSVSNDPGPDLTSAAAAPPSWRVQISGQHRAPGGAPTEDPFVVSLDAPRPAIVPGGWAVVERPVVAGSPPQPDLVIARVTGVREASRADYGITGRSTLVRLDRPWLTLGPSGDTFAVIRGSAIYAQSEPLELLDEPIDPVQEPVGGGEILLQGLFDGLKPGRRLIVSGERTDVTADPGGRSASAASDSESLEVAIGGVHAVEVVMLAAVRQEVDLREPAAKTRSTLVLAAPLAYRYRRDTVAIHANVLKATHGETRTEVLGSGDGKVPNQSFELKQKPLTHVSAVTPTGTQSTLDISVDHVRWRESDSPVGLSPTDRRWVSSTDDDDVTTVTFGNGTEGARLPSGLENVTAVYRFGIGKAGNVAAEQLTLLTTRPSGVVSVTNPQPASGGADRESRDQARSNIPLAVTALDRIVSVQDYADFARTFAGIGKASSARLSSGRQELVHLTIAGEEDIPILPSSDLYRNVRGALAAFGEPFQPFQVDVRRLRLMVVVAKVAVHPDHHWEDVEPTVRAALLDRFSFRRRELGQDVARSEVLSAVQAVPGVVYVDLDILDTVDESQVVRELSGPTPGGLASGLRLNDRLRAHLARTVAEPAPTILPAELIVLSPAAPPTLTLTLLESER